MARGSITGVGLVASTIRFQPSLGGIKDPVRVPNRQFHRSAFLKFAQVLGLLLISMCGALPVIAQSDQSDVHVVPREQKKDAQHDPTVMPPDVAAAAKEAGVSVDPSLKTH